SWFPEVNQYNETGSEHPSKCPGCQEVLSECDKHALQNVIFSDESRFCLYKSDDRERVWRRVTKKYHRECINMTVKYSGGSVMFWDCFSWWGVGPLVEVKGNMNSDSYVNWIKSHGFNILEWVPYSPNLNLIKNLWERLDSMLRKRRPAPETREELVMCIKEEWHKMLLEYIRSLICSILDRMMAIYMAKGWHSRY
ncbi:1878_t:CDS:2, partial [Gigaspora margarita]